MNIGTRSMTLHNTDHALLRPVLGPRDRRASTANVSISKHLCQVGAAVRILFF